MPGVSSVAGHRLDLSAIPTQDDIVDVSYAAVVGASTGWGLKDHLSPGDSETAVFEGGNVWATELGYTQAAVLTPERILCEVNRTRKYGSERIQDGEVDI